MDNAINKNKQTYYLLPLDNYNQPSGDIVPIQMTDDEYETLKNKGHYIYKDYKSALWRAQD